MFYDAHAHAFVPKIAPKILEQLHGHYGIPPVGNGLIEDLLAREARAGIDKVVVMNAATRPNQVVPANNWALSLQKDYPDQVVPFGTLHPYMDDWESELDRLRQAGIKGLKFHPEFQDFWLNDPKMKDIMEAAWQDFIFMLHVGDRPLPEDNQSCPFKVAELHRCFPGARIIAAHLGGYLHWSWALEALAGKPVYFDTSSSLEFIDEFTLKELFRRHPREYFLFGSDYPLFDPLADQQLLKSRLNLKELELEALMSNAAALFE